MNWSKAVDWFLIGVVIAYVIAAIFRPYDSTDDEGTRTRSGLYLYTDHATNCQYIKASWFAELTPRMVWVNSQYVHVCGPYRRHVEGDYRD